MAYDKGLAARIEEYLGPRPYLEAKRMFGGIAWMNAGHLFVGIIGDDLIIRVGEAQADALINHETIKPFDLTGRVMKGWAMATPDAIAEDRDLADLVEMTLAFTNQLPPKD